MYYCICLYVQIRRYTFMYVACIMWGVVIVYDVVGMMLLVSFHFTSLFLRYFLLSFSLFSLLLTSLPPSLSLSLTQAQRPLQVGEGDLLHPQCARGTTLGGPVRTNEHHQQGEMLLQTHLCQGLLIAKMMSLLHHNDVIPTNIYK